MEAVKGTPLFVGHRAFGSLFKYILIFFLLTALAIYLFIYHRGFYTIVLYTFIVDGLAISLTGGMMLAGGIIIIGIIIYIKHIEYTYIITTSQVIARQGIIMADVKNYIYSNIQEASSFQTIGQRLLFWGQLKITMLIELTGQSKVEEAHLNYIHRPKHIANLMISAGQSR